MSRQDAARHAARHTARPAASAGARITVAPIALADGRSLTYQRLPDRRRIDLAGFKCPKDMGLLPALPRDRSGKALRRTLREPDASGCPDAQEGMS